VFMRLCHVLFVAMFLRSSYHASTTGRLESPKILGAQAPQGGIRMTREYRYNVTGKDRKALVAAVAEILGTTSKYCAAPNYEYQIGDYTVDRDGTLIGPEDISLMAWLEQKGFEIETEVRQEAESSPDVTLEPEEIAAETETTPEPVENAAVAEITPEQGENAAADAETTPEPVENAATAEKPPKSGKTARGKRKSEPDASETAPETGETTAKTETSPETGENTPETSESAPGTSEIAPEPAETAPVQATETEPDRLTIEYPLTNITDEVLANLRKMVAAKEPLLKKALNADELPIFLTPNSLKFPWFTGPFDENKAQAYAQFISCLCETAKRKKRVTAQVIDTDNPRFSMRVWLISLGMIGQEYGLSRQLLYKNLDGDSGWRYGKPEKTEKPVDMPNTGDPSPDSAEADSGQ